MKSLNTLLTLFVLMSCTTLVGAGQQEITVAVLEDHKYPGHMKNVVDIIGKSNATVYLANIEKNEEYIRELRKISYSDAKIVNLSIQSCFFYLKEKALIEQMINDGKIVVVASGNKDRKYSDCPTIYPAGYKLKGLIVAGYKKGRQENVDVHAKGRHCTQPFNCMSGSSQAAAQVSRQILELMKKDIHKSVIVDLFDKR